MILPLRTPPSDEGFTKNKYARSLQGASLDPKFYYLRQHTSEHSIRSALCTPLLKVRKCQYSTLWSVFTTMGRSTTIIRISSGPCNHICFFPVWLFSLSQQTQPKDFVLFVQNLLAAMRFGNSHQHSGMTYHKSEANCFPEGDIS